MAFKARGVGLHTSMGGAGGFVVYVSNDDAIAAIRDDAYWNDAAYTALSAEDRRAYDALVDFVQKQELTTGEHGGVPFVGIGNAGGGNWNRITVQGGRLQVEAAS